jgi:HD-like signal output (HDOD) protein
MKWGLGLELLQVIKWHHNPEGAEEPYSDAPALVHTANYICNIENIGISGDTAPTFIPGVWKRLGLAVGDISDVVDKVHEEAKKSEILMSFV